MKKIKMCCLMLCVSLFSAACGKDSTVDNTVDTADLNESMFTYEFKPDEYASLSISVEMMIKQVEGLEYSIVLLEDIIISEPSPDWGINIYLTEDHSNYLYFYGSQSPGGINLYPDGPKDINYVKINEKDMAWGIFDGDVIGSYKVTDEYRIIFELDESLWDENKELIMDLIESARIEQHIYSALSNSK